MKPKRIESSSPNFSNEAKVHHIFESISGKYDTMNNIITLFLHKRWRRNVINKVGIEKGTCVIDLCCGTGEWLLELAQKVGSQGKVYGVDFSKGMLNKAREKLVSPDLDHVKLLYGNIRSLPFAESYFDYAIMGFGLRNVSGTTDVLREIQRVLKTGGKLACLDTSRPSSPLLRYLLFLYMRYFVPILGFVCVRRFKEYRWLQESTWQFPDKDELADIFRKVGFGDIIVTEFLYGVVTLYIMVKN